MESTELSGILDFIRRAERLKNTARSGFTSEGRVESAAEHTWRLSLMALVLDPYFPDVDFSRLIKICIIHDLGEAISGDIPAPQQGEIGAKAGQERRDLLQLLGSLPPALSEEIVELWDEYEHATTAEARLAKALDKLETILQHNQGSNPADFDYGFNLDYGRKFTSRDPLIAKIRAVLDDETRRRAEEGANR